MHVRYSCEEYGMHVGSSCEECGMMEVRHLRSVE